MDTRDLLSQARWLSCQLLEHAAELARPRDRQGNGLSDAEAMVGDDPCANEQAIYDTAVGVYNAASVALSVAEAAKNLAEMNLMECRANNP